MKTGTLASLYAAMAVAGLLILTAWGNAVAMLTFSTVGVLIGLLMFTKGDARHRAPAVALVACAVAVAVTVTVLYR